MDGEKGISEKRSAGAITVALAALGRLVIVSVGGFLSFVGGMSVLLGKVGNSTMKDLFTPSRRFGKDALLVQMVRVGVKAIAIVVLIQMSIGMILPLQMYPMLEKFDQAEQIASINAVAAFRELGPLMTAVVLCGFAGASIAAELGTMVTSEEIEALEASALSPVRFLVVPRLIATVIMTVLLTVIADVVMISSGVLTAIKLGIDPNTYYTMTLEAVDVTGFVTGLIKAAVFGLLIGLTACYLGLSVKPWQGSNGVGKATTNTVVYSLVAVMGADAIFTLIFYAYGLFS
jgi:phospholipid/cholesterol/gamma-HCH transport system permease protein